MDTGYQSAVTLDQFVFNGNIPAQYSIGDFGTALGTDTYTLALQPALTEYRNGLPLRVLFDNTNTGPVTLNVDNLGAVPVRMNAGVNLMAELSAGEIKAGKVYVMVYINGTLQLLNHAIGRAPEGSGKDTGSLKSNTDGDGLS